MRYYNIIWLLILVSICACNAKHEPTTRENAFNAYRLEQIISDIAENNIIEGENVGIAGSRSTQRVRYKVLNKLASDDELISLTYHTNPVVRYYSFRALVSRNSSKVFDILVRHMNDTATKVQTLSGCIGFTHTLRCELIAAANSEDSESDGFHLNDVQSHL